MFNQQRQKHEVFSFQYFQSCRFREEQERNEKLFGNDMTEITENWKRKIGNGDREYINAYSEHHGNCSPRQSAETAENENGSLLTKQKYPSHSHNFLLTNEESLSLHQKTKRPFIPS